MGQFTSSYWWIFNAFITKNICDTIKMDFDLLIENKSGLGTAGIIVINKDQDILAAWLELPDFINTKAVVSVLHAEKAQGGCGEF